MTRGMILAAAFVGVVTAPAQAPLALRGTASQPERVPGTPVVTPLAMIFPEVTGPGEMFPALMALPEGDDLAHFGYEEEEYFVSGTANGAPYATRIVIRKPSDDPRFSGIVVAESMHPSGNAWMFHFTHTYTMGIRSHRAGDRHQPAGAVSGVQPRPLQHSPNSAGTGE